MNKLAFFLILVLILIAGSCTKDEIIVPDLPDSGQYSHKVPFTWNNLYLEIERYTPGYRPPVSARNIAYINMGAYEAMVPGSNGLYNSFDGYFDGLSIPKPESGEVYSWEVSVHAAYNKGFELFFPTAPPAQQFRILEVSDNLNTLLRSTTDAGVFTRSYRYGEALAEAIYNWSTADNWGHEAYLKNTDPAYSPPAGPGRWEPTFPDYQPALLPHWGKVRPFAAKEEDRVLAPPGYSTAEISQIYQEAEMTMELVNDVKSGLREEDYWIAEFWSDDCPVLTFSPAGRWISITNQVIGIERPDLMETVAVYTKVSFALSDAGMKCWGEKYKFNTMRPIDYIRAHLGDPDWNTVMCPDGTGQYYTPNFPSYPSGHATFGAAAARVLEDVFGTDYRFTDRSHEGRTEFRGKPRMFNSFAEMADENAYSRVPLGVHFISDSEAGLELGIRIGDRVNALPWN